MPTLEAIETKIRGLQEQAKAIKAKKASATLDRIVDLMRSNGVTVADIEAHLGGKKRGAKPSRKAPAGTATAAAKYMDPKTGATWSGRGRAPAWIANAKNRDRFLVDGNASKASVSTGSKANRPGNYRRGPQPAKYRDPESGATWSGRGPAPAWLANVKDRSKFALATAAGDLKAASRSATKKATARRLSRAEQGGAGERASLVVAEIGLSTPS
jgi:DNA-binding protein H-NS